MTAPYRNPKFTDEKIEYYLTCPPDTILNVPEDILETYGENSDEAKSYHTSFYAKTLRAAAQQIGNNESFVELISNYFEHTQLMVSQGKSQLDLEYNEDGWFTILEQVAPRVSSVLGSKGDEPIDRMFLEYVMYLVWYKDREGISDG